MNLTSKSRYAFKIMVDIARQPQDARLDRSLIAQRLHIPSHYLDQILLRLKKAEIIQSYRGRLGGFILTKPPHEVSVLDIVKAVEDDIAPVACLEHGGFCPLADDCISKDAWHLVANRLQESLEQISLSELSRFENSNKKPLRTGARGLERETAVSTLNIRRARRVGRNESKTMNHVHLEKPN